MKRILQDSTARIWCLSGLTGMVLLAGMFLEIGQARTYSPIPVLTSIENSKLDLHWASSKSKSAHIEKSVPLKSTGGGKTKDPTSHQQLADKNSAKKRMGAAMIFLGILAKKS